MVQKTYEVTVEAFVQRTIVVSAPDIDAAEIAACEEVKSLVGALSTEVLEARKIGGDHGLS